MPAGLLPGMAWSCVLYGRVSVAAIQSGVCAGLPFRARDRLLFRTRGRRWLIREGGGRCGGVRDAAPPLAPPLKGRGYGIDARPLKGRSYGVDVPPLKGRGCGVEDRLVGRGFSWQDLRRCLGVAGSEPLA